MTDTHGTTRSDLMSLHEVETELRRQSQTRRCFPDAPALNAQDGAVGLRENSRDKDAASRTL